MKNDEVDISVIVPARNEQCLIGQTLSRLLLARRYAQDLRIEIIVVDNESSDNTEQIARKYMQEQCTFTRCRKLKSPCARNHGAALARGRIFVFVDADTIIPETGLERVFELTEKYDVGIFRIDSLESGLRAKFWWGFWNMVRILPLAHAKALPAFMFCTREAFKKFGPFDENVRIGEEWPITADSYRHSPSRFVYDRSIAAQTSSRRMEQAFFGYSLTFLKYVWAILHRSGRLNYSDVYR